MGHFVEIEVTCLDARPDRLFVATAIGQHDREGPQSKLARQRKAARQPPWLVHHPPAKCPRTCAISSLRSRRTNSGQRLSPMKSLKSLRSMVEMASGGPSTNKAATKSRCVQETVKTGSTWTAQKTAKLEERLTPHGLVVHDQEDQKFSIEIKNQDQANGLVEGHKERGRVENSNKDLGQRHLHVHFKKCHHNHLKVRLHVHCDLVEWALKFIQWIVTTILELA
ncbi:hypothetical protein MTO96_032282 [Rhipicephalus appendiculatus]